MYAARVERSWRRRRGRGRRDAAEQIGGRRPGRRRRGTGRDQAVQLRAELGAVPRAVARSISRRRRRARLREQRVRGARAATGRWPYRYFAQLDARVAIRGRDARRERRTFRRGARVDCGAGPRVGGGRARAARQLVVPRVVREVPRLVTYPRLVAEETPERNNAATHRRITTRCLSFQLHVNYPEMDVVSARVNMGRGGHADPASAPYAKSWDCRLGFTYGTCTAIRYHGTRRYQYRTEVGRMPSTSTCVCTWRKL